MKYKVQLKRSVVKTLKSLPKKEVRKIAKKNRFFGKKSRSKGLQKAQGGKRFIPRSGGRLSNIVFFPEFESDCLGDSRWSSKRYIQRSLSTRTKLKARM